MCTYKYKGCVWDMACFIEHCRLCKCNIYCGGVAMNSKNWINRRARDLHGARNRTPRSWAVCTDREWISSALAIGVLEGLINNNPMGKRKRKYSGRRQQQRHALIYRRSMVALSKLWKRKECRMRRCFC